MTQFSRQFGVLVAAALTSGALGGLLSLAFENAQDFVLSAWFQTSLNGLRTSDSVYTAVCISLTLVSLNAPLDLRRCLFLAGLTTTVVMTCMGAVAAPPIDNPAAWAVNGTVFGVMLGLALGVMLYLLRSARQTVEVGKYSFSVRDLLIAVTGLAALLARMVTLVTEIR